MRDLQLHLPDFQVKSLSQRLVKALQLSLMLENVQQLQETSEETTFTH